MSESSRNAQKMSLQAAAKYLRFANDSLLDFCDYAKESGDCKEQCPFADKCFKETDDTPLDLYRAYKTVLSALEEVSVNG